MVKSCRFSTAAASNLVRVWSLGMHTDVYDRGDCAGGSPHVRSPGGQYITRVQRPVPTRQHPLSGLWKGDAGKDGIHIFSISSDFSGPAARISAVQVALLAWKWY